MREGLFFMGRLSKTPSIVILTHDKRLYTEVCLDSLLEGNDRPFELIVVDNGSRDGTREFVENWMTEHRDEGVQGKLIRHETNLGCSTARNAGMSAATGDPIVFLDNDAAVRTRSWLSGLADFLGNHADAGAVAPKLVFPAPPNLIECAGCLVSVRGRVGYRGRGEPRIAEGFNRIEKLQCVISACVAVPRAVAEEVGPFDEIFNPVQFEDIDYCYRIRETGKSVYYFPEVEMYHWENTTTAGTDLNFRYLTVKNGMKFKEKWARRFVEEGKREEEEPVWRDLPIASPAEVSPLRFID